MNDTTLIISGGTVVCEDAVLPDHDVFVRSGRIAAIRPSAGYRLADGTDDSSLAIVDARGAYVAPGMIDVHSDFIETVASPRPSVVMDLCTSLYQAERELAAHGITTIFHSLSVYGAAIFDHKPIRNFENVMNLVEEVSAMRSVEEAEHLIRHRLHLRIEIDSVDRYDAIKECIAAGSVDMISFMDHTPGQGQYSDLGIFGNTLKGYRDISDQEVARIIEEQQRSEKLSLAQMTELARLARRRGISVASHDDDAIEKLDRMAALDAAISEFPITMDVAHEARKRGMHTLAGAPNVMMGHSHSGNLSAREAVGEDAIDMLCSDYYPAAMLGAVFVLHRIVGLDLARAFALVTAHPAQAAGISDEVGSIAVGKRADLIVVRELPVRGASEDESVPVVTEAFVGGRCVHRSLYPAFEDVLADGDARRRRAADAPVAADQASADRSALDFAAVEDEAAQIDFEKAQAVR